MTGSPQTERPSTPPIQPYSGIPRPLSSIPSLQAIHVPQTFFGSSAPSFSSSISPSSGVPSPQEPSHLPISESDCAEPPPGSPPLPESSLTVLQVVIPLSTPHVLVPEARAESLMEPDLSFDDDGLSTLEKIYLFSRSQATYHRVFIAHSLPSLLPEVTPSDAVDYVLPLLNSLAMDEDEQVKEALIAELVPILWWFLSNCRVVEELPAESTENPTLLSVQSFTPLLGTLLLSQNSIIGLPTRQAVVNLLNRVRESGEHADEMSGRTSLFGMTERHLFEKEILQQVVIGIGRLDMTDDHDSALLALTDSAVSGPEGSHLEGSFTQQDNMFFPPLPQQIPSPTPQPQFETPRSLLVTLPPASRTALAAELHPFQSEASVSHTDTPVQSRTLGDHIATDKDKDKSADSSTKCPQPDFNSASGVGPLSATQPHDDEESWMMREDSGPKENSSNDDGDTAETAVVGRISSMSLMAAITASGSLSEDTKAAFVGEVERVGRDPIYWVRREAAFALGALAKVVPEEVVICSLLPLFESMSRDTAWHVRHSSLFALPAVLSRLSAHKRRSLALHTLLPLMTDISSTVRSGVLEVLGEVIYTFQEDPSGPPEEIIRMFVGRDEDRRNRTEEPHRWFGDRDRPWTSPRAPWPDASNEAQKPVIKGPFDLSPEQTALSPIDAFFRDPERTLICAFNYPAVVLTLGGDRWHELRDFYIYLSQEKTLKVQRTLAASIGEVAKIIGPENAKRDLLQVWLTCSRHEDGDVRLKTIESLEAFLGALSDTDRVDFAELLEDIYVESLRGWRERAALVKCITALAILLQNSDDVLRALTKRGLADEVAAVREAVISIIPQLLVSLRYRQNIKITIRDDIRQFARDLSFRKRLTFVACYQAFIVANLDEFQVQDDDFWEPFSLLAKDEIVDVRIGVARLAGYIYASHDRDSFQIPRPALQIVEELRQDASPDVRSFLSRPASHIPLSSQATSGVLNLGVFSRPPLIALPQATPINEMQNPGNSDSHFANRKSIGMTQGRPASSETRNPIISGTLESSSEVVVGGAVRRQRHTQRAVQG